MEIWREIKTFKNVRNKYYISNLGRIMNKKGEIMKTQPDKDGFLKKVFYIEQIQGKKITETYMVHRLVALHFLECTCNSLQYVHHINGNNQDNRACNLKWIDRKTLDSVIQGVKNKKVVFF